MNLNTNRNTADTFAENYAILKRVADTLRSNEDVDIDELAPMVEEATRAYRVCQDRIANAKKALDALEAPPAVAEDDPDLEIPF
jgi:exodeoxyribonuclease VII small subunit